ncbi:hypothetical protein [Burkholderia sp. WSM2230]|uniref:hypothetical protein n=1 Tax=Burkholderia sp. WSM2230 TaxID=944435 RepID=UPI001E42A584|nr:hypothetical protein [Burkholderia sp. WSM2230]
MQGLFEQIGEGGLAGAGYSGQPDGERALALDARAVRWLDARQAFNDDLRWLSFHMVLWFARYSRLAARATRYAFCCAGNELESIRE